MTTASQETTAAADARMPSAHPIAQHLRRVAALESADPHRPWSPDSARGRVVGSAGPSVVGEAVCAFCAAVGEAGRSEVAPGLRQGVP
jgi:hypothetical protein